MKRFYAICLTLIIFVSLFTGCSGDSAKGSRPVAEIYADIEALGVLPAMQTLDADYIENYYGIDLSTVSEYVFSVSSDVVRSDMVILVRVKENTDAVKETLNLILSQNMAEMKNYLPDQYDVLKKASVEEVGDLVYLVVSPDRDAILEEIIK